MDPGTNHCHSSLILEDRLHEAILDPVAIGDRECPLLMGHVCCPLVSARNRPIVGSLQIRRHYLHRRNADRPFLSFQIGSLPFAVGSEWLGIGAYFQSVLRLFALARSILDVSARSISETELLLGARRRHLLRTRRFH